MHKYPSNDAKDLPDNVRFGDALGEWEDEFKKDGGHIKEIVVGGAKSYSYVTNKDKFVVTFSQAAFKAFHTFRAPIAPLLASSVSNQN